MVATLISTKDPRFGTGKKIEDGTFTDLNDPAENGVPHRFSNKQEVNNVFSDFKLIEAEEKEGFSDRRKMRSVHWEIIAERK